jgi:molybdate transport system permease protein
MYAIDPSPLLVSLATTVSATAVTFVLGLFAAWRMLKVRNSLRAWLDGLLTLPLILPPTVVGYFLLIVFGRRSPIGMALEQLGVTIIFSWPATVIAATVVAFPLMYRTTLGAFEQVNSALPDAARTLGASEGRIFRRILLPLAGPGVLAGAVLAFARALGEFGATLMLAGNIPGRTQTIPLAIFSAVEEGNPQATYLWVAVIVLLSIGMIQLLHLPQRNFFSRRRVAAPARAETAYRIGTTNAQCAESNLSVDVVKSLESFCLDLNFQTKNRIVGLLGESGAGKSMTFRMIAGIETPDSGHIQLSGRILYDSARKVNLPAAQRKVGVVFQDYALFPHYTAAENVEFALHEFPAAERRGRALQLLELLQVQDLSERFPRDCPLPGDESRRAFVRRTLLRSRPALAPQYGRASSRHSPKLFRRHSVCYARYGRGLPLLRRPDRRPSGKDHQPHGKTCFIRRSTDGSRSAPDRLQEYRRGATARGFALSGGRVGLSASPVQALFKRGFSSWLQVTSLRICRTRRRWQQYISLLAG